jgi:hypothetical protein
MPEPGAYSAEARGPIIIPDFLGAVFKQGRNASAVKDWLTQESLVPALDVTRDGERERWVLENIGTFSLFAASPESKWRGVVDFWRSDLNSAAGKARLEREKRLRTDEELRAMMAVTASARAMEISAGSMETYAYCMVAGDPNSDALDRADTWGAYLIHGDKKKLDLVTNHFLVGRYCQRLLADAGIVDHNINVDAARHSELAKYLTSKKPEDAPNDWRYRGMAEYMSDYLLAADDQQFINELSQKGLDDLSRAAAARLAADTFLIDKYTRWEFATDPEGKLRMKPTEDWGGDPLRNLVEPSFLPRRVKGMYKDRPEILDNIDEAFRMDAAAVTNGTFRENRLMASMTTGLKPLIRYSKALFALLGGTRAASVPLWTKDTPKDLVTIAEMFDTIYGNIEEEGTHFPVGKHVVGAMIARVIFTKALAAVQETAPPDIRDRMAYVLETEGAEPFKDAIVSLWGPKLDGTEGWLKSLTAARTGIVFRPNIFPEVVETLRNTRLLLEFNDQRAQGIESGQRWKLVKGIFKFARGIAAMPVRY